MQEVTEALKKPKLLLKEITVSQLRSGQYQPRQIFPEEGLKLLAETIKRVGVLEPLLVRSLNNSSYEIIAGERRWRAAMIANLESIPCLVGCYNDEQASQIALIENLNREDLNPIDEAMAIDRIIREFVYTHEEAGSILGLPRSHITNLLRLMKLDMRVQDFLSKKTLSEAHGKILSGIPLEKQYFFAKQCVEKQWSTRVLNKVLKIPVKNNKNDKTQKKDINILSLEKEVSERFGHMISFIVDGKKGGFVKIRFCNFDELDNILSKLK
jgi:ParB family chromosome partitioning protein